MEFDLSNLISAVSEAVQSAQNAIDRYAVERYFDDFVEVESSKLATGEASMPEEPALMPKTRKIMMPAGRGAVEVPLTSLMSHQSLCLEQVKVNMKVNANIQRNRFLVSTAPSDNVAEGETEKSNIELIFKREAPSEGIARLKQQTVSHL